MTINAGSRVISINPSSDGKLYSKFPLGTSAWGLPPTASHSAVLPLRKVYPQPDASTPSYARHRLAHTGMDYVVPVGVSWGRWPYRYELVTAPTGATIGEELDATVEGSKTVYSVGADYGVVTWPAASVASAGAGPHTFSVKVTDQDGNSVTLTWTVAVDDTAFIFLDSVGGNDTTGSGTKASPWASVHKIMGAAYSETTYQQKVVVFRSGTYSLQAEGNRHTGTSHMSGCNPIEHNKPRAWVGFPGESPVIDCSAAYCSIGQDSYVGNLIFDGTTTGKDDAYHLEQNDYTDSRITIFGCTFRNLEYGTVGGSNAGAIYIAGIEDTAEKQHLLISRCRFTDIGTSSGVATVGPQAWTTYWMKDILVEHNAIDNCTLKYGGMFKNGSAYVCARANVALTAVDSDRGILNFRGMNIADAIGTNPARYMEACHNLLVNTGTDNWSVGVFVDPGSAKTTDGDYYLYRNTMSVPAIAVAAIKNSESDGAHSGPILVEENVLVDPGAVYYQPSGTMDTANNLESTGAAIDASGLLTGASRTTYLGLRGHEVAA